MARISRRWIWFIGSVLVLNLIVFQHCSARNAQSSGLEASDRTVLAGPPHWIAAHPVGPQSVNYAMPQESVYVVAPEGKADNPGTVAAPLPLWKALQVAPRGATIVLRGGTYRTGYYQDDQTEVDETTIRQAITLQPYQDEKPILKGSLVATDWTVDGNAWRTPWSYHFPPSKSTVEEVTDANPMAAYNDGVWIDGEALTQVSSRAQVGPATFYLDYNTNTLYIGSDPRTKTVEVTAFSTGLRTERLREPGVTIRGLTLMHYASNAVFITAPHVLLENNLLTQNRRSGFFVGTLGPRMPEHSGDAIVRNNELSQNGTSGGGSVRGARLLFENNLVRGNNTKQADYSAGGMKFSRADSTVIRHNLFEDNRGVSLWFDGGSTNATIVDNVIQGAAAIGIFWEISDRGIMAGNLLTNNGEGIRLSGSTNAQIYNNTFLNNGSVTIRASDRDRRGQSGPGYIANTLIKNNLFASTSGQPERILSFKTSLCEQPLVTELDYNAYYRRNLNQPQQLIEWEKYPYDAKCPNQQGDLYPNLTSFQSAVGFEKHGLERSGSPDPFFVDQIDYRLKANSPAIGAGESLPPEIAQALGWSTQAAVDLGAFQSR